jgi:hypothetical protein
MLLWRCVVDLFRSSGVSYALPLHTLHPRDLSPGRYLSRFLLVDTLTPHFSKMHFNIILPAVLEYVLPYHPIHACYKCGPWCPWCGLQLHAGAAVPTRGEELASVELATPPNSILQLLSPLWPPVCVTGAS